LGYYERLFLDNIYWCICSCSYC